MKFGNLLNSIKVITAAVSGINEIKSKTERAETVAGIKHLFELINEDFNKSVDKFDSDGDEAYLDSQLEYLAMQIKDLK